VSSNGKLGWGLVGASDIARTRMVKAINCQPDSAVVALMSSQLERAQHFATELNIPHSYASLDALLGDPAVDVVYISTTNDHHRGQTLAAAQAAKHVLCEKPLALSLADAAEMVDACHVAGVVFGTNHHLRNAATHRAMRRVISEGAIGEPLAARVFHAGYLPTRLQGWRLDQPAAGGGVALDITVHDADTLRFDLDDEAVEATALGVRQGLAREGLEDGVMSIVRFRSGLLAQCHDAFTLRFASTGMQVHGTEGSLLAEDVMTQEPGGRVFLRTQDGTQEIDVGPREDLYERSVRAFNAAVRGEGQPAASGEDGVRSLAIALAVQESMRSGQTRPVAEA
jgi:1,5-anhydro-D-fructose reductase (1,5-anhydro-D-mannitol-forming)